APQRLVGGIPPLSPQGWESREGRRRSDVRYAIRTDDVAPRLDSQVLSQLPPQTRISETRDRMMSRSFVVWNSMQSEFGNYSWAIVDNMVCVRAPHGQKCTQIGGSPPDHIARILARELGALARCDDC